MRLSFHWSFHLEHSLFLCDMLRLCVSSCLCAQSSRYTHAYFFVCLIVCCTCPGLSWGWALKDMIIIIITIIMIIIISSSSSISLPRGSLGHHRWFCNQFSPFFPVFHCPLGPAELRACPFPSVVFPPLPLSALSSSPFNVPRKVVLARPDNRRHDHTTAVCISLHWSRGLCVVWLHAGSWHGLPCW